ncbi:hypothetical protein HGRIS_014885 [Hohenbuehelia grisea]|uniref:Uncharacterized protein n=1 Tax=Hohenbuehelia grisea TaxID=104357 RepID=A0ABR3IR17_9AGAR
MSDVRCRVEHLMAAAKASKAGFDYTYFVAGVLMFPEGVILTGKLALAAVRFVHRLTIVQKLASWIRTAESGSAAAAEAAANELEKAALEAEKAAQEVGAAGEAGEGVAQVASRWAKVAKFLKVIGAIGFVVTIIVGIIEAIEGAKQKEKLIEAIQGAQPARLCIAFFKREATNLMQQLELFSAWLDFKVGEDKDDVLADRLAQKIVKNISVENAKIDWSVLETQLETQDRSSAGSSYYADADLFHDEVVKRALGSMKSD